jgi:hypothetical protein
MKSVHMSTIVAIYAFMALPVFAADPVKLESAGVMTFGAENVLFVSDIRAGGVHA